MPDAPSVLILGAGPIGLGFAAACAAAGWAVTICDPDARAREAAPAGLARQAEAMARAELPVGGLEGVQIIADLPPRIEAALVLEAGPEKTEVKSAIFADLLSRSGADTLLATTSSAIPISAILPAPEAQRRALVAHPANPPSLIRVLELVPAPGTAAESLSRAAELFTEAGFDPVVLGQELPAFVFNRLQSALLREAYRLVEEGVVDVAGLDRLVRDGLGPRWALSGPFETADLNTKGGVRGHAERLGPAYAAIGRARGETHPDWPPALVDRVEAARRALLPEDQLPARRAWRERALADLLRARRAILKEA
ncbi:3-hydroxyacyl-CoA dehydrogenase NAD-binding domain-containing protein [Roseivivax sp.]